MEEEPLPGGNWKKRFWQTKITFPIVWPFQAPTLQIHPKEWLSASKNNLFKSWPLLTTSSGRTSTKRFFGSEIHLPHQFSSRFSSTIIDFFKPKASTSGHVLGIYVNLILFFFLIVLPENQTKGRTNTKCQYPPLFTQPPLFLWVQDMRYT